MRGLSEIRTKQQTEIVYKWIMCAGGNVHGEHIETWSVRSGKRSN